MNRRGFLTGFAGLLAAPAIVRVSSLMPMSVLPVEAKAILPLPYKQPMYVGDVLVVGRDAFGRLTTEKVNIATGISVEQFRHVESIQVVLSTEPFETTNMMVPRKVVIG